MANDPLPPILFSPFPLPPSHSIIFPAPPICLSVSCVVDRSVACFLRSKLRIHCRWGTFFLLIGIPVKKPAYGKIDRNLLPLTNSVTFTYRDEKRFGRPPSRLSPPSLVFGNVFSTCSLPLPLLWTPHRQNVVREGGMEEESGYSRVLLPR